MKKSQDQYQYRPLDTESKEIRLLRIVKTKSSDAIVLELRHTTLSRDEEFYALSYTWGEEPPLHEILIDDSTESGAVSVRPNLIQFLEYARSSAQAWSSEWIWIDQICIHQDEHHERCQQVGLMGELYTAAKATLIWPGLPSTANHEPLLSEQDPSSFGVPVFDADELAGLHVPEKKYTCVTPSVKLRQQCKCSVILRVKRYSPCVILHTGEDYGIVQEIVLASQSFVLMDSHMFALGDLHDAISILLTNMDHAKMKGWLPLEDQIYSLTRRTRHLLFQNLMIKDRCIAVQEGTYKGFAGSYTQWDLAVTMARDSNCSLQLDRVYGVMGLLIHKDLWIEPDYTISQEELLRRVLKAQLRFSVARLDVEGISSVWEVLYWITRFSKSIFGVKQIEPDGLVERPQRPEKSDTEKWREWYSIIQHNARLVLRELDIPIPRQITDHYGVDCPCEYHSINTTRETATTLGSTISPATTAPPTQMYALSSIQIAENAEAPPINA